MKIGVVGLGVVGSAVFKVFRERFPDTVGSDPAHQGHQDFSALIPCDVVFLCLPTPTRAGWQDASAVTETVERLDREGFQGIAAIKSTVLPGTTATLAGRVRFPVAHNPEFLSARSAEQDFCRQRSVLIGCADQKAVTILSTLYGRLLGPAKELEIRSYTDPTVTEMAKYMSNVFFAVKVGLFNEFADVCKEVGVSYELARQAACSATEWLNPMHTLVPGPDGQRGFGGMCFPKDVTAWVSRFDSPIVRAAYEQNYPRRSDEMLAQWGSR
jgi:UDPglucose 6-dehydrogenase